MDSEQMAVDAVVVDEQAPLPSGESILADPEPINPDNVTKEQPAEVGQAPGKATESRPDTTTNGSERTVENSPQRPSSPRTVDMAMQSPDEQQHADSPRPLNVTDALSYLDAVKVQFHDQPDVYNHFLDIMKEFKSQLIDTPGVIKRVSHLFNGHPSLIQGFNTFLPVGYRIECSSDDRDGFITVTTPTGTTMQTTNNGLDKGPILWSTLPAGSNEPFVPPPPSRPSRHARTPDPRLYPAEGEAIEPAVDYVRKIKQRCDIETYRQFLDILSQYHQKPDSITEEEVSKQIARLFRDAPDLRSEFRIFMPEQSHALLDDTALAMERIGTPSGEGRSSKRKGGENVSASVPQKRKRKPEKEVLPPPKQSSSGTARTKKLKQESSTSSRHNYPPPPSVPDRRPSNYGVVPAASTSKAPPPSPDETQFFERVRHSLDSRDTYNEFIKIINLFTQGIIDTARLARESRNFLGDGELMRQWREILGWDDRKEREAWEQQQQGWTRPTIAGIKDRPSRVDTSRMYGSYRRLPKDEIEVACSGRDEMCRSVLNDEWVSHPTWTSEDSGFIAHKKNIYEEALHRSEEERHEYDFHIDAIGRTILMLEPINNKIAMLPPEDRGNFKLKANLGGSAKAIHHRVIKKIYGREAGMDVIQAMQDSPAQAVPVVLTRLKQKEEEWNRAKREWNKVWMEVDARNYAKSLDHQSINFKATDKKATSSKALVNQIEAAREEQMAKRASLIDPLFARTRPRHQLEFVMDDVQVLQDALKLTYSYLDRTQGIIHQADRKRIEGFFRSFVPLFFMLDKTSFNAAFVVVQESVDSDVSDIDIGDDVEVSSASSKTSKGRKSAPSGGDLRKKLLKSEQAKLTNRRTRAQEAASPSLSRLASPIPQELQEEDASNDGRRAPRKNIFFTNTAFYVALRLLQLLYSRLAMFKAISQKLAADARATGKSPLSTTLGISQNEIINYGDRLANAEHFYDLLLDACEKLFDNEVEQHVFEDQMRYMFGVKDAYKAFTIDKLIAALIKQAQVVIADNDSQHLLEALKRDRAIPSPTTQDQINSRRNAEKVLGPDENLFRVDWLPDSKTMTMQLIGKDDSSFDDSEVLTGRWQMYIDSFVSSEDTEGVSQSRLKRPFLRKNLPSPLPSPPNVVSADGLEIKVCIRTYRLFFVSHTADYLWKARDPREVQKAQQQLQVRNILRRKWLDKASGPREANAKA